MRYFSWTKKYFPLVLVAALTIAVGGTAIIYHRSEISLDPVTGVVWQLDDATVHPSGYWQKIGAHRLIVQWTYVDGKAYLAQDKLPTHSVLPDWARIAKQPWAREIILGLAGEFDENQARANVAALVTLSKQVPDAARNSGLNIVGWYFPVEVDPTWRNAAQLGLQLAALPRPLWISVYDRGNIGPKSLADWLATWLPDDVGVLFHDGVGTAAREPRIARQYADELRARLGSIRLGLIVEAFRQADKPSFRPATATELMSQLAAYSGHVNYLFDGPHYVSSALVDTIAKQLR